MLVVDEEPIDSLVDLRGELAGLARDEVRSSS
jgi:hypothetical protein